ncbi:MAG: MerR family transcriptional regulator [Rickettsiales bacterium]|jgi:DNA-binding transcriptional MerR regulator|nr:MerR family transcriptional regulator [Rickettsiales bacterium]
MTDKEKSIGIVSTEVGIKEHAIRFWEKSFPQIRPSLIGKNNRRYYCNKDIENILKIKYFLYEKGYTINGLKKILNENKNIFKKELSEIKEIFRVDNKNNIEKVFPVDEINRIYDRFKKIEIRINEL